MKVRYIKPKPDKKPSGKPRVWSVELDQTFSEQNKKAIKKLEKLSGLPIPLPKSKKK